MDFYGFFGCYFVLADIPLVLISMFFNVNFFCLNLVIVIDHFLISDLNAWQRLPDWRSEYRAKTSVADYNVTCDKSFCN